MDLGRRALPALVEVTFVDRPDVEWVAVSLDGTVAGLGLVDVVSGTALSRVVVDPALVGPTNLVEVWAVTDDGLVPLAPAG